MLTFLPYWKKKHHKSLGLNERNFRQYYNIWCMVNEIFLFLYYCRSPLIQLASLSIELILSGYKNTAQFMSLTAHHVVVAVKEWRSVISAPKTFHPAITN